MYKRLLTLILAALLLIPLFAACGESSTNADPVASPETTADPAPAADTPAGAEEEEAEEDPDAILYKDLPAGNYDGKTFTVLAPRHTEYDFVGDIEGDVISEAVYKRNQIVEDALSITFNPVLEPGLWTAFYRRSKTPSWRQTTRIS